MADQYIDACRQELEKLVSREPDLDAALLCSVDGLPVAFACENELETDSMSAMCSSMLSLGDALSIQGGDESCIQVVTQSRGCTFALIHAGDDMLLALMGNRSLKLGMLLGHARKEVEIIVELMSKSNAHDKKGKAASLFKNKEPALLEELVNRVVREAQDKQ
ncbi:roadblock/LC7 domain-containing protein [Mariprofundus sp. EBB-1]|uniref:roadblock/LC7 domain-containing protein n=1 Tax=Mariprofundus sp. EBB-1 TaxID=2650971 RepID=UPI000EF1EA18|nr:roadblock/LC7 domain-containing protein [Mariprofundus sp. EBB-1]RLL50726.1 roadblock/LC7 domain-containing protein [Mariprofundus sp. EBB-1]